ncbi:MAG: hypothetical protein PHQ80_02765 [Candidatus ainarchaeum sp.]|nr:hypothetical protein [Candidatus ainarchaeum sp.]
MVVGERPAPGPESRARMLAERAAGHAKEGRRRVSEVAFRKAFEAVSEMKGRLGTPRNDVYERSELAAELAEEVVSAGLGAEFALEMWGIGCNAKALGDEAGGVTLVYPLEIMEMAAQEVRGEEDGGVPPVVCEVKGRPGRVIEKKGILEEMVGVARQLPFVGSLFGEEGEGGEAGKD